MGKKMKSLTHPKWYLRAVYVTSWFQDFQMLLSEFDHILSHNDSVQRYKGKLEQDEILCEYSLKLNTGLLTLFSPINMINPARKLSKQNNEGQNLPFCTSRSNGDRYKVIYSANVQKRHYEQYQNWLKQFFQLKKKKVYTNQETFNFKAFTVNVDFQSIWKVHKVWWLYHYYSLQK